MSQRKFAAFDIDGTLIRWQLYHAIFDQLVKTGKLNSTDAEAVETARMTWKRRGQGDTFKAYEHTLWQAYMAAITNLSLHDVDDAIESVFETYKDQVYTFTRDLIQKLKSEGYLLFALSGSHHEAVVKLAEYYGFDDAAGTVYLQENGVFTGEEINVLSDKGAALKAMTRKYGVTWKGSVAVGDTARDHKMLELTERSIAFNPDSGLFDIARERGWEIVVERKNVIYKLGPENGSYILA